MRTNWSRSAITSLIALVTALLTGNAESPSFAPSPAKAEQTAVLAGAGDIADCNTLAGAEGTAKLLDKIPGTVMAVGDLAYPDGSKENSEARHAEAFGVLKLTLYANSYDWQFIAEEGNTYTDSGSGLCH